VRLLCKRKDLEGAMAKYRECKEEGLKLDPSIYQDLLGVCSGVSQRASRHAPKGQPWREPDVKSEDGPPAKKRAKLDDGGDDGGGGPGDDDDVKMDEVVALETTEENKETTECEDKAPPPPPPPPPPKDDDAADAAAAEEDDAAEEEEDLDAEEEKREEEPRRDGEEEDEVPLGDDNAKEEVSRRRAFAFEVYEDMKASNVAVKEAAVTMLVRVCCLDDDPDAAAEIVATLAGTREKTKLRTVSPLLRCYCRLGRVREAIELRDRCADGFVTFGETEHVALIAAVAKKKKDDPEMRALVPELMDLMAADVSVVLSPASWTVLADAVDRPSTHTTAAEVSKDGVCSQCGSRLRSVDLDASQRETMLKKIEVLVPQSSNGNNNPSSDDRYSPQDADAARRAKQFAVYKKWLSQQLPFDFVVDGANVGYFNQNYAGAPDHVDFQNIDVILRHCLTADLPGVTRTQEDHKESHKDDKGDDTEDEEEEAEGKKTDNNKGDAAADDSAAAAGSSSLPTTTKNTRQNKVLILLHARHLGDDRLPPYAKDIVKEWRRGKHLYSCAPGNNDDWYWLYAAVASSDTPCYLVSNDEMRDHHFGMLSQGAFLNWKERHLTKFDFGPYHRLGGRRVDLAPPPAYSTRMQRDDGGNWHVPLRVTPDPHPSGGRRGANAVEAQQRDNEANLPVVPPPTPQRVVVQRPNDADVRWLCLHCLAATPTCTPADAEEKKTDEPHQPPRLDDDRPLSSFIEK